MRSTRFFKKEIWSLSDILLFCSWADGVFNEQFAGRSIGKINMSTGTGPSPSNTNSTPTPSTSTRSRLLLLNQTPPSSTATTSIASTPKGPSIQYPVVDEKLFSRYSNTLAAETHRRKSEVADHMKRLAELRKQAEYLDDTDWMFEPVERLLGK